MDDGLFRADDLDLDTARTGRQQRIATGPDDGLRLRERERASENSEGAGPGPSPRERRTGVPASPTPAPLSSSSSPGIDRGGETTHATTERSQRRRERLREPWGSDAAPSTTTSAGKSSPSAAAESAAGSVVGSVAGSAAGSALTEEIEEAMRLQSLERFIHRMDAKERTTSSTRRAQVEAARRGSVCGTGVADRKVLGAASKSKIQRMQKKKSEAVALVAMAAAAAGSRAAAAGLGSERSAAGSERAGVGGRGGVGDETHEARRSPGSSQGKEVNRGGLSHRGCWLAAGGGGVDGFSKAATESGEDGVFHQKGRPSITSLGVSARGTLTDHPAAALLEEIASPAPLLTADKGWTLQGKVCGSGDGGGGSGERPHSQTQARRDGEHGARREEVSDDAQTVSRGGSQRRTEDDQGAEGVDADEGEDEDESSVLDTLRAAGDTVLLLSLHERKALFEVAIREQVDALSRRLFDPRKDGVIPRVSVDVALE